MKTYAISLKRVSERYNYIRTHVEERGLDFELIDAVDGSQLSDARLAETCDMKKVEKLRWWLSNGAIACAMSHQLAYERLINSKEKAAFIVEDDVILPSNIQQLLTEIEAEIRPTEIVLLYYTSFKPAKFSSIGGRKLSSGGLYYPMDIAQPITAAAYVIGREAAKRLKESFYPIRTTADCWGHFYNDGNFDSLRVHFPALVKTKNFKSSIDYLKPGSLKSKLAAFINQHQIPPFYQYLQKKRQKRLDSMLGHFVLVEEESPILLKQKS